MKLTLEMHNTKYIVEEDRDDFNAQEMQYIFSRLLVNAGYPPSILSDEDGGYEIGDL